MTTVYLETTIPSYLAARRSRDLVVAAHQQITEEWWERSRSAHELYVSEAVLEEIRAGDASVAARRLKLVDELPVLELNDETRRLARIYTERLPLPPKARADLLHIAFTVAHGLDYLLTWNCKHIANGQVIRRLLAVNDELEVATPVIVTPEELLEGPLGGEP